MYDSKGNLKSGYTNERSLPYKLFDTATGTVRESGLRTPNEAADLNHILRQTNLRWIPATV